MFKTSKILIISNILMLAACATVPDTPRTFDELGHYQQTALNASSYRISFRGNPQMSYGTAEEITLLKAAQITVQQGFDAFKVIDDPTNRMNQQPRRQTMIYQDRAFFPPFGHPYPVRPWRPYWNDPFFDRGYEDRAYLVELDPVEVSYTIQMFKKDNATGDTFDARRILQSLGAKYGVHSDGRVSLPENNKNTPIGTP